MTKSFNAAVLGKRFNESPEISGTSPITLTAENLPDGLSFDTSTWKIYGTPTKEGKFSVNFTAQNSAGKVSKKIKFVVNSAPVIADVKMETATAGTNYTKKFTVTGTKKIIWTLDGDLPEKMSFKNGTLKGKPQTSGVFYFTITASNDYGIDSKTLSLDVKAVKPTITGKLKAGKAGKSYKSILKVKGTQPIKWILSGDLPSGINFNEGSFTGTTSVAFKGSVIVTASNDGGYDRKTFTLEIKGNSKTQSAINNRDSESINDYQEHQTTENLNENVNVNVDMNVIDDVYDENEYYSVIEELPDDFVIVGEISALSVDESGQYDFDVVLNENAVDGEKLYFVANSSKYSNDDSICEFYDDEGNEIENVPENHNITVSIWLNEGIIYKPVIAVKKTQ